MNVSLTPDQVRFIERRVKTGRYQTAAEVVREGLRLLMEHEADAERRYQAWCKELRRKIDEGWSQAQRGEFVDGEAVFRKLETELQAPVKKRKSRE